MQNLINKIQELKNSEIKNKIDSKIKQFQAFKKANEAEIFKELCFCILTANFQAEKSIEIQNQINNGFLTLSEKELAKKLKQLGHRFPNARAKYISNARNHKIIKDREWLIKNIKGLGYKESSHFLRNIGFTDHAIIDFHIIDLLTKYKIIKKSKSLSKKNYLKIESKLKEIAQKTDLNMSELDLYLWYLETGKILK